MKYLMRAMLLAGALLFVAPASQAQLFVAELNGANEATPNNSPGIGTAFVTLDPVGHTMRVEATFSGLLAPTTAAHIHGPTPTPLTGEASVATTTPSFVGFPLGVTSGSFNELYDMTLASSYRAGFITANGGTPASAEAALFAAIMDGKAYFNIHTAAPNGFPGGEIRGFFVAAVPEPGAVALFVGMGVTGLMALRRRRR
jgi:hypothetical protein